MKGLIKTAVILAILALLGYIGWQFIAMQIKTMQVESDVEETLYGEFKSDEYLVVERTIEKLKERGIEIEYSDIQIEKEKSFIKVEFSYTDSITIPFIKKSFYFIKDINAQVAPH